MTLKNYLGVMTVLTVICWGFFVFVAKLVDPFATNWLGFLLFYLTLLISLIGTISLVGFIIRFIVQKKELVFNSIKTAFRQSFLFSLFIIVVLILKVQSLFSWLNLLLLVIIFAILEVFLIGRNK
jgi:hypothetical protein